MEIALEKYPVSYFSEPEDLVSINSKPLFRGVYQGGSTIKIDKQTGGVATDETPEEFIEEIVIPEYHSILHWVDVDNPRGLVPTEKNDAYENWEHGVQKWVSENQESINSDLSDTISGLMDLLDGGVNPGDLMELININNKEESEDFNKSELDFEILSPGNDDEFRETGSVYIKINKFDNSKINKFYFYVNDKYIGSTNRNSYSFKISDIDGIEKENILKITSENSFEQKFSKNILFNIR